MEIRFSKILRERRSLPGAKASVNETWVRLLHAPGSLRQQTQVTSSGHPELQEGKGILLLEKRPCSAIALCPLMHENKNVWVGRQVIALSSRPSLFDFSLCPLPP